MEQSAEQGTATATRTGGDLDPRNTTGRCLLSLDGGGVRGLSTIYILKSIMDGLNHERKKNQLPSVKPCQVFDLIGGTGTGGLIAIMLGRLEMDVDKCIEAYNGIAASVFGGSPSPVPVDPTGKDPASFDLATLERAIRKMIVDSGRGENDLFDDQVERGCKTFVCTADRYAKDIVRLRSYTLPEERSIYATICEAALATSATTTLFEPVRIGARSFADGNLGANNPVDEVEGEASNIWCPDGGDLKPLVKCFISIGTGNPGKKPFEEGMTEYLTQTVVQIATETEATETKFIARWKKHFDEKRYFRLSVDQGLQEIGLAEYERQGAIEAATDSYLRHAERRSRVRDCIHNLVSKKTTPAVHFKVRFGRNSDFVGRETILERLMAKVPPVKEKDDCQWIVIKGLGGTGKTQIALEIAYRVRDKYPSCSVFWVPAITVTTFENAYRNIGQALGTPGIEDNKADVKSLVKIALEKRSSDWLLIIDNIDDISLLDGEGLQKYLPFSRNGSILFTTRNKEVAVKLDTSRKDICTIKQMSETEALKLLQSRVGERQYSDGQATKDLLNHLAYLPLAIKQASTYMAIRNTTTSEYLQYCRESDEKQMKLLSTGFGDRARYSPDTNPIATTWLISFQHLERTYPLAVEYLKFICFLAEKDIPTSLLSHGEDPQAENEALGILEGYAFISMREMPLTFIA